MPAAHGRHQRLVRPFQHDDVLFGRRGGAVEIHLELAALAGIVENLGLLLQQAGHPPRLAGFGFENSP